MTTRDIAEQLDLSVSTVGRALANDSRISHATRLRVEQKAQELGYIGNLAARLMRGAKSTVVGLIVPDIRNTYFNTVAHALTQSLGQRGYQVMLSEADEDPVAELARLRGMIAAQVAGIIIVPTRKPHAETVALLRQIPHAQFLRHRPELGEHWFGVDDRGALRTATQHLYDLGHRRIGYFGVEAGMSTTDLRFQGYLDVVGEARGDLVIHAPGGAVLETRRALGSMLSRDEPPTAIVNASIRTTESLLQELAERDIPVPEALSVVGFGDKPGFAWWGPGLTTMAVPVDGVADACGMWLLQRLGHADSDGQVPHRMVVSGHLVERSSTAPPAGGVARRAARRASSRQRA